MDWLFAEPGDYLFTRWLFLRLLGIIYLIAFASFGIQGIALIGEKGILPARNYLQAVKRALGKKGYFYYPTLAWINSSDRALNLFWVAGVLLSVLLIFGLQTTPILFLLWIAYLSLVTIGQVFLSYQWDVLLLEAGFLAIFLVPPSLLPGQAAAPPSPWIILLFRWLLFRLMFMSGILKLASRDPTWRSLTALSYHYETQPLPNPPSWYFHHAPQGFQKFSTLFALGVEIVLPFLFFGPAPLRIAAGLGTLVLQILIQMTGNFAFFNLLTSILLVPLLDDSMFRQFLPASLIQLGGSYPGTEVAWGSWLPIALAVIQGGTGLILLLLRLNRKLKPWRRIQTWIRFTMALHLANTYGLFTVMTTQRPEIIIEGSQDGENWMAYEFKYKPGDLTRSPSFVAPHQPRLDWQMWFAALGTVSENPWFLHFVERLLENNPQVSRLLAKNPFQDEPPTFIRAVLYDYRFSSPLEKSQKACWWQRERLDLYMPPVSLEGPP